MLKRYTFFLLLFTALAFDGFGQTTFTWNFGTSPGSAATSSGSLADLTVSNLSIGNTNGTVTMLSTTSASSGYTGSSGQYNAGNAAIIGALNTAASGSAYFEFTLTPTVGYIINLSSISFGARGTSTAPVNYTLRSSLDSYASDIATGTLLANSTWALKTNSGLTFTGTAGTAITFRIYGYGGTGSPGASTINWRIDDLSIIVSLTSSGLTPPTLVADAIANNVDNEIDITFTDDETWRDAITDVKIGGVSLNASDYNKTISGTLRLKPSIGNSLLTTSGSKVVTVIATGYTTASVTQQINPGAVTANSTATISAALTLGSTRTVTVTAKDQYSNLVTADPYIFKFDVDVTNIDGTNNETYTIAGADFSSDLNNQSLSATDAGVKTFDITIPATVDENDGVSVQVLLNDGTTDINSPFEFFGGPPSATNVSLTSMVAINANIIKGRDNNILQRFDFAVTGDDAVLNSLTVTTAGTYVVADIKTNGFKLWYSADTLLNSLTDVLLSTKAAVGPSNNLVFGSLSSTILEDASGYYFVTADISNDATASHTVQIAGTAFSNISFASANLTGTNPIPAGGIKTIAALSLPLTEHFDYATGSVTTNGAGWVNTSGTAGQVTVETGNLTYTGYDMPATGKSITIIPTESEDVRLVFPDVTTGKVYASFLLNVSAILGTDVYSIHLGNGATTFTSRVYAKVDGAGFALSIGKSAVSTYSSMLNFNQTYLIVISYEFVDGATNDIVNLWINPDLSGAVPASTISSSSGTDVTIINAFYVRQLTGIPTASIDAIRIATNWADAPLPVELTSFTARAAGNVVNLNWETKTEVDNNGFDVERNSTGTWQKIGFVEGHGTANSPKYYTFTDKSVTGNKIQYRLRQVDNDGTFEYSNVVEVELAPTTFTLDQNYPNPFNPATIIRFSLPTSSVVTLNVYNTLGEKVVTLLNGAMESGYHQVSFDAANLPSGLYLYEIKAGEFSSIKKMLLMK